MQETQETWVQSLGWEDPLEEKMATCSSILAWKIPWTEEPCGLQSTGSQRVGWTTEDSTDEKCVPSACQSGNPYWQKLTQHCEAFILQFKKI